MASPTQTHSLIDGRSPCSIITAQSEGTLSGQRTVAGCTSEARCRDQDRARTRNGDSQRTVSNWQDCQLFQTRLIGPSSSSTTAGAAQTYDSPSPSALRASVKGRRRRRDDGRATQPVIGGNQQRRYQRRIDFKSSIPLPGRFPGAISRHCSAIPRIRAGRGLAAINSFGRSLFTPGSFPLTSLASMHAQL